MDLAEDIELLHKSRLTPFYKNGVHEIKNPFLNAMPASGKEKCLVLEGQQPFSRTMPMQNRH
jgi:hypothetical protein